MIETLTGKLRDAVLIKNAALDKVRANLNAQAATCEGVAELTDNPAAITGSGFPLQNDSVRTTSMAAPTGMAVSQGDHTGEVGWHCDAVPKAKFYSVQSCIADPAISANWKAAAGSSRSRGTVEGFTPGQLVWLRTRAEGPNDLSSPWSAPAMALAAA